MNEFLDNILKEKEKLDQRWEIPEEPKKIPEKRKITKQEID